jgi:surface carbohydrate biosynthesis protein
LHRVRTEVDGVLLIEHVARELDVACAVKHLAESRHGLTVVLATRYHDVERTLMRYRPRAVVLPYCYAGGPWVDVLQRWQGMPYVNLAYEQLFSTLTSGYKIPKGHFAKERVLHVAWGDFYRNHLISHGVRPENIIVNGNPSYALYKAPYRDYFDARETLASRHGLDPGRHWVFVPENYGIIFVEPDRYRGYCNAMGEATVEAWRENTARSFEEAASWWCAAAEAGAEVIVRPRPALPAGTFSDGLLEAVQRLPGNLHVIKDGSVKEWSLASDLVVSNYSTTLVEAAVAGKPVFMLEPIPLPEFVHSGWHDLARRITTKDEFITAGIDEPELSHTSRKICCRQSLCVLAHGIVADNLDRQIR